MGGAISSRYRYMPQGGHGSDVLYLGNMASISTASRGTSRRISTVLRATSRRTSSVSRPVNLVFLHYGLEVD
jgi:hypothetical protein